MNSVPSQMPLDLGHAPSYLEEDFLFAPSNMEALQWLHRWPDWPHFSLALYGSAGSGKTHLAHIFAARSSGIFASADALGDIAALAAHRAVIVEDGDRGIDEEALLHLHNLLRESGHFLLLTGRAPPSRWKIDLPDLHSRLAAIPAIEIGSPDDALLHAVLLKLFADRQLPVSEEVLAYLLARMERSFAAARALVAALDLASLSRQRAITIQLAREILAESSDPSKDRQV